VVSRDQIDRRANYWLWFWRGTSGSPGWQSLILEWWVIPHLVIGVGLAWACADAKLKETATSALLPLAGVLISITFAWATNVQSILQSREWVSIHEDGGVEDTVFEYLNSILLMIITIALWGICALGLFDRLLVKGQAPPLSYQAISALVYFATSYSIHHCWKVVSMAQMKLVAVLLLGASSRDVEERSKGVVVRLAERRAQLEAAEKEATEKEAKPSRSRKAK